MNSQLSDKTVFVLDHTQYFGISAEKIIDLSSFKSKFPVAPLSKTLWTFSIEAAIEYCRIVWDLFANEKLVRLIVSDSAAHVVNTWSTSTQNINYVTNAMSIVGVPENASHPTEHSVIHGLRAAIDALAEPSEVQKSLPKNLKNIGRVVCITSARDNESMASLEDIFQTVLSQHNEFAAKNTNIMSVDLCHLVILNIIPSHMGLLVSSRAAKSISDNLTSEIHSVFASDLSKKLTHLILSHLDLASTTVTGIPMKEEQNANSSANYDVEIFHSRNSHTAIFASDFTPTMKTGSDYETVTLKWSTPRGCGSNDFQFCLSQDRITPVDVTSRPSSCLINFLLNGRSVLLEMPRKSGGKQTSHLLTARGGEIFIHSMPLTRSCLEDFPSISEGNGGKVIDYRIADFNSSIQMNCLVPFNSYNEANCDENMVNARAKLNKNTNYFPLTLGLTMIYNIKPHIDVLLALIRKEELNESDVSQCQQVIFALLSLTNRQDSSPFTLGQKCRGARKEEQTALLWTELELLIHNSGSSLGHKAVLHSLNECKTKCIEISSPDVHRSADESDVSKERMDTFGSKYVSDVSMSPVLSDTITRSKRGLPFSGNRSLLSVVTSNHKKQIQKRIDFAGRMCTLPGQVTKLYANLAKTERTAPKVPNVQ